MKRTSTLVILLLGLCLHATGQLLQPFRPADQAGTVPADRHIRAFRSFLFDGEQFETKKNLIPHIDQIQQLSNSNAIIELPLADGSYVRCFIAEVNILSKESALLYPQIKTYDLLSVDGLISGRATSSQLGFSMMLLTPLGRQYVAPFSNEDPVRHAAYFFRDYEWPEDQIIRCGVDEIAGSASLNKTTVQLGACQQVKTFTIAVAATGEFTTWAGSQANAIASITTTIGNISLLYSKEVHVALSLVTNNSIVFTNAATDPYATVTFPGITELNTNHTTLNTNIGSANYDLGIVFNEGWNGGLAYSPAVCDASVKGGAAAGLQTSPSGPFMEGVVAHEIAHMFSAQHTMSSGTDASCASNLNLPTAYEPGGGSTIMAYAGAVCTGMFYQNNTDFYFHYNSVVTILNYAYNIATCGTLGTTIPNTPPVLTVPAASHAIPHSTPFELTGTASDPNAGNMITYSYEQYDAALAPMTTPPAPTNTTGPMFRSYPPSTSNTRIFPPLANILDNTSNTWEVLTSVSRALNFKVLARDNATAGCLAEESVVVNVNAGAGPFAITSQNTTASFTANGTNTIPVTWNVAGTTSAPVSSANVNILFSTDNGQTFPYTLASNTANDGTQSVIVPNVNTSNGRIKVKSANNIFFDINNAKLTVTSSCTANGSTFSPSANVTALEGNPALNLSLTPNYGSVLSISGNITSTDPTSTLAVVNVSGSACANFGNLFQHDLFTFQVNVAGTYSFATAGATPFGTIMNLYENSFSASSPCVNFVTSNAIFTGSVAINTSLSATLTPGITYVLAIGTFNNTLPTLPFAYSVSVTPPAGGNIYTGVPNPGASFSYRYVIVNNTTGNIVAITSTPDMTNTGTYPAGSYTVWGLSISSSVSQATLNTYVGGSFSTFQTALLNSTLCGNLSGNSILVTILSPLKLTGMNLSAAASGTRARLDWKTQGEEDVMHYLVEKSTAGDDFLVIGNVPASGKGSYTFYDEAPVKGGNFYRIKAREKGGLELYSNIATLYFQPLTGGQALIFPNPVTGEAIARLPVEGLYDCVLTDISGQVVHSFTAAEAEFKVDLSKLSAGVYLLRCHGPQGQVVSRIVKQ